jgi:hypothetical protein
MSKLSDRAVTAIEAALDQSKYRFIREETAAVVLDEATGIHVDFNEFPGIIQSLGFRCTDGYVWEDPA